VEYSESLSKNRGACYKKGKNNFFGPNYKKSQGNILPTTRNHREISLPSTGELNISYVF
jgi:hypothetical protein